MGRNVRSWCFSLLLLMANDAFSQEGSLRGAPNGMGRRQQDFVNYPKYEKFYSESGVSRYVPDNDLVFLGQSESRGIGNRDKSPLEYLEDLDLNGRQSAFRERKLQENHLHEQNLPELILNEAKNNPEYAELLRELYQKYSMYEPQNSDYYGDLYEKNELKKKNRRYAHMGLNMVGMKKRSQSYTPTDESGESLYLLNVPSMRNQMYSNSMAKRFPVTKRSSTYYPIPFTNEMPRQFKRSSHSNKERLLQTDPKVEQDLSSIFNHNSNRKDEKQNEEDKVVTKPKRTEHATETSKATTDTTSKSPVTTSTLTPKTKEDSVGDNKVGEKEKPIQIKKKSIDWSDYFGVDKRKKANNLDNEWLMERYHKAVALTSKRASAENVEENSSDRANKSRASSTDEKIVDMDNKLKNIEYAIVDDALKASRAQESEFDSKEVREMKDRIISQLAAAYSLEKMRRALNEYRESIKKERLALKQQAVKNENTKEEEKRLSVPRKSAGSMEIATSDNNIKCSNSDENCVEQNYKTPEDLLESINFGYCPKVERACAEIASILGQYEKMLATACTMHQMCLLCGDNNWYSPTRQCNVLFLSKADYLCNDDIECREVARHSTRYLLELNRLLKSEPLDKCDLQC